MSSLFIIIILVNVGLYNSNVLGQPLKVSVYYEALCPDSISFITAQLHPAWKLIGSNIDLDLVPYGKASQSINNGKWTFRCQHGPAECRGNKYQACGLSASQNATDKVNFVNCVMSDWYPENESTIKKCAPILGLTGDTIIQCADSVIGDALLAENGDKTHAVLPPITFIPTIIFNDLYDPIKQNNALGDFLATACAEFRVKPSICV